MADLVVILTLIGVFTVCYGVITLVEQLHRRESSR